MDKGVQNIKIFKFFSMIVDILIVCASFYGAIWLRNYSVVIQQSSINSIFVSLPIMCLFTVVLLYVYGMYSLLTKTVYDILLSVAIICFINIVLTMAVTFFLREFSFPRSTIFFSGIIQFCLLSFVRYISLLIVLKTYEKQTLLVVGMDYEIKDVAKKIILTSKHLYTVKYFINVKDNLSIVKGLMKKVDHVVICPDVSEKDKAIIFSYCMELNTGSFLVPTLFDISIKNSILHQFDDMPTFKIGTLSLTNEQRLIKRLFDIIISLIALAISSPIMLLVAIAIKLTSPGPIIFKQERVTENNRLYNIYKFRTMVNNAEKLTGPVLASEKDPRITKTGEFLRLTRLDELPQFFNVLIGDMSIVGPRPERMHFIKQFKKDLPEFEYRISVRAGITGLAQVLGKYTTNASDKLIYDLLYIRNYSFLLDIQILFQTIRIALTKSSSQGLGKDEMLEDIVMKNGGKMVFKDSYWEIINKK